MAAAIWIDGRALKPLPFAKFDGGIDQSGAGALLLAFTQSECRFPPNFSHEGDANAAS